MTFERIFEAAQGYMELGLMDQALHELDSLPQKEREAENALQLRLLILMRMHAWEEGLAVSEKLRSLYPRLTIGHIHGAYCLHELGRTGEARDLLLNGPRDVLRQEATFFYNLACYEAAVGEKEQALQYLKTSFEINAAFREMAKVDPDLRSLREFLK